MRFVLPAAGILAACVCFGSVSVSAAGPEAGAFNPYVQKTFPSSFTPKGKSAQILNALGGEPQSILTDTAYRPHNREELYPVLFGDRRAPHEILVFLIFPNLRAPRCGRPSGKPCLPSAPHRPELSFWPVTGNPMAWI